MSSEGSFFLPDLVGKMKTWKISDESVESATRTFCTRIEKGLYRKFLFEIKIEFVYYINHIIYLHLTMYNKLYYSFLFLRKNICMSFDLLFHKLILKWKIFKFIVIIWLCNLRYNFCIWRLIFKRRSWNYSPTSAFLYALLLPFVIVVLRFYISN